jgi:lipopolysaccharide assembly protein A
MGTYVKWIMIIVILLFFITFGVKNSQSVSLNYYFDIERIELPLYGLVFISILVGIVAGMIIGITDRLALKTKVQDLAKENRTLQEEIALAKAPADSRVKEEASMQGSGKMHEATKTIAG